MDTLPQGTWKNKSSDNAWEEDTAMRSLGESNTNPHAQLLIMRPTYHD